MSKGTFTSPFDGMGMNGTDGDLVVLKFHTGLDVSAP